MKAQNFNKTWLFLLITFVFLFACSKNNSTPAPTVLKEWVVTMNSKFEVPAPAGRTETGIATLDLYSDMMMKFTITVSGLAAGDQLTASHIHLGDPMTSGAILLGFNPSFTNGTATGQVTVPSTLADSLKNGLADFYINVHSTQIPGGLLRGQLNNPVTFAQDIILTGANEVPAVSTTATGVALLRLTTDKTLYAKVTVTGLEAGDTLTASHIHAAATGVNGNIIVPLCSSAADFGKVLKLPVLTDGNVTLIQTGQVYVNAHSKNHPGGLIRGQIR
jgi:CHRD domain